MTIEPAKFEDGQTCAWSTKERCEMIVAHWQRGRESGSASYRIHPAREEFSHAPDWAHLIEVRSI